jgi:hypothetical protein
MANPVAPKAPAPVAPVAKPVAVPGRKRGPFVHNPEVFNARLTSASGKEMLRVTAQKAKTGKYISYVRHFTMVDGKLKAGAGRGATQEAVDFAGAKTSAEATIASAVKLGWLLKKSAGGGPRRDAFDAAHIPAPTA